jgi:hypothetical protein
MNRFLVVLGLWLLPSAAWAETLRLGLTLGGSLLTQKDTSLTHASLTDEVTAGPTVLGGLMGEVAFDGNDRMALEVILGPYHNDVERSCIFRVGIDTEPCQPVPFTSVSRAVLWGMQYSHAFGESGWRPYLTGGFGVKTQWIKSEVVEDAEHDRNSRATVALGVGVERAGRRPFRIEARGVTVLQNPFFPSDKKRFELQVRAAFLLPLD